LFNEKRNFNLTIKLDIIFLLILSVIALIVGVYLIVTAVLISKDGCIYIEHARNISTDPIGVCRRCSPGYSFIIYIVHQCVTLFGGGISLSTWIYCAQFANLLCRILAIVPLYFIGKFLVGSARSFWAILILIILPAPAVFGSDVLRDWPHILFLAWGFLFLIIGAKQEKWWVFGCAGVIAGFGYIVRPECAQIVIYGLLWLAFGWFWSGYNRMSRTKLVGAMLVLLAGFIFTAGPYQKIAGLPEKVKYLFSYFDPLLSQRIHNINLNNNNLAYNTAGLPGNISVAVLTLMNEININLFYFFTPPLWIGFYSRFRRELMTTNIERFFVSVFVVFNMSMLIILYCYWQYISARHCLPLVVFLIYYVPVGLEILANWFRNSLFRAIDVDPKRWFFVLLAVGLISCLPKIVRPMHIDKQGYRDAAKWLRENTKEEALIAVPDIRITFYAERKILMIYDGHVPEQADYVVGIVGNKNEKPEFDKNAKEEYSTWVDEHKKDKKLIVYRMNR
jgi:hypothetical protein